jgi:hypothetical protein
LEYKELPYRNIFFYLPINNLFLNFFDNPSSFIQDPLRFAKPSGSAFDHGTGGSSAPSPAFPPGGLQGRPVRQRAAKSTAPSRGGGSGRPPLKKELTAFEKTFAIQNPRDLPEFTVVDLADLRGGTFLRGAMMIMLVTHFRRTH